MYGSLANHMLQGLQGLWTDQELQFGPGLPEPQNVQSEAKICVIQPIRAEIHGSQQWPWPYMV